MQFFFFNDTAPTEIYTLSLHDALPIWPVGVDAVRDGTRMLRDADDAGGGAGGVHPERGMRSEEHTSELQSRLHLVCRLLLEKKNSTFKYGSLIILLPAKLFLKITCTQS